MIVHNNKWKVFFSIFSTWKRKLLDCVSISLIAPSIAAALVGSLKYFLWVVLSVISVFLLLWPFCFC